MAAPTPYVPSVERPTFTGELPPAEMLLAFSHLRRYYTYLLDKGVVEEKAFDHVTAECLAGPAATWWLSEDHVGVDYDAFQRKLSDRFLNSADRLTAARTLFYESRQGYKPIQRYEEDFKKHSEMLRALGFDWATDGPKVVFLNGLNDACKGPMANVHDVESMTIGQIAQLIKAVELTGKAVGRDGQTRNTSGRISRTNNNYNSNTNNYNSNTNNNNSGANSAPHAVREQRFAGPSRHDGRSRGNSVGFGTREPRDLSNVTCHRCGQLGHLKAECRSGNANTNANRGQR